MREVVVISGHICTGKSELARRLSDEFGYLLVKTSDKLKEEAKKRGLRMDRVALQELGDIIDKETGHKWLLDACIKAANEKEETEPLVVDSIRRCEQLEHFRRHYAFRVIHAHLWASPQILKARFSARNAIIDPKERESITYEQADLIKDENDIEKFRRDADVRVNIERTDSNDTLVRVAARLGLYSPPNIRCVDVVVGGQYGSEGKGHVAAYLAKDYDVLVRVGGPNAGHTVSSASGVNKYVQLPSGSRDTKARLLIGPGATIRVQNLIEEIGECNVTPDRLFIDPQAMTIEDKDIEEEKKLIASISSTGRGGGAAAARRIMGRTKGEVRLARDIPELEPYVGVSPNFRGSTRHRLEEAYRKGRTILLEGTQGSGLSIYHGQYPHVTSRDTNVAGCLAEAGISPSRVRRIIMVVRSTPIRVGNPPNNPENTSGGLKHETRFSEVARRAGIDGKELEQHEVGTISKKPRRVGWF